ncbi:hypothetical protein SLEP1_g19507 [Rubroshorea leprosula]|uniref:Reverse transcriptase zinc-binding domain-containing protein n=1 Tax=Rubroshorea leprosula TaxID=152421 RepID=A0AAV5J5L4_9ROSI|nr:hypothetical protein SLEP1_g19507 [Rubroshorea leprosula]
MIAFALLIAPLPMSGRLVEHHGLSEEIASWAATVMVSQWISNGAWPIPVSFVGDPEWSTRLAREIQAMEIDGNKDQALLVTLNGQLRKFSIAYCYEILQLKKRKVRLYSMIWAKDVIPRHSFMVWLLVRDRPKT